jgi:predicted transposase YbfD/YdcC
LSTHDCGEETTFFDKLRSCPELDLRDKRGLRHEMAFNLYCLTLSLLRNRDGNLSSMHRCMVNNNSLVCQALKLDQQGVISRPHLPIFLSKVNLSCLEKLVLDHYGVQLSETEEAWFAGDGKELRGSIARGDKRGEALVQLVRHEDRGVLAQDSYNGTKESEKPCLRRVIKQSGATGQKITADALHLNPAMTAPIERAGGIYLIGLKANQKELLNDMIEHAEQFAPCKTNKTVDKGHGRLETRKYEQYNIKGEVFAKRWKRSAFRSLFKVDRTRFCLTTRQQSYETAYYISNSTAKQDDGCWQAIRNHWSVEVSNHARDVNLKEDHLRTKYPSVTHAIANLRTLVLEIFRQLKPPSIAATMDLFQDDFNAMMTALKRIGFL